VRAAILDRQCVTIRASWTAGNAALVLIAGMPGSGLPGPVVGHSPFEREDATIVVGDDQIEWLGGIGLGHRPILAFEIGTVHGFRSSFMDWVAEVHPQRLLEAERALDHQIGSQVQRAYLRTDFIEQRRELAELWAGHLSDAGS
jgi:hypothetical protein